MVAHNLNRKLQQKANIQKLLVQNSPVVNRTHLKKQLIAHGFLKNKCLWCGIGPTWRGKAMTLEMDHINGNNTDNRLENLRILCLHCHSQTPTFRRPKAFLQKEAEKKLSNTCVFKFKRFCKKLCLCTGMAVTTGLICAAIYYFH